MTDISEAASAARCRRHYVEYDPTDHNPVPSERRVLFSVHAGSWINLEKLSPTALAALETAGALTMTATEFYTRCNNRIAALQQAYGISP